MKAGITFSVALAVLAPSAVPADPAVHESPWEDATWLAESTAARCALRHPVAGFGEVLFEREAAAPLALRIRAARPLRTGADGVWFAVPPPWKRGALPDLEIATELERGNPALRTDEPVSDRMLAALEQGFGVGLQVDATPGQPEGAIAVLSPVRFAPALAEFDRCSLGLLPYGYADVAEIRVTFGPSDMAIEPHHARELQRLARFLGADPAHYRVLVEGHSDSRGSAAHKRKLAAERAALVRKSLLAHGVPADRIEVRVHGDQMPQATNRSETGRAQNRVAVVTLLRVDG